MTVIVWDGRIVAADKMASNHGYPTTVTKLFRSGREPTTVLAIAGELAPGLQMVAWYEAGADAATLPAFQHTEDFVSVLKVTPTGAWKFEKGPIPFKIEDDIYAMGSGRDYALAALELGCSALKAVMVASKFDNDCGNGADWMEP